MAKKLDFTGCKVQLVCGMVCEILSVVKDHDYGTQQRFRVSVMVPGSSVIVGRNKKDRRRRRTEPKFAQVNESQIEKFLR